jgi:hypothetical protein
VQFWANAVGIFLLTVIASLFALALLYRVGTWTVRPIVSLTFDEGLRIGSPAPQVAATDSKGHEIHLSFGGSDTFLVFGNSICEPCSGLLQAAPAHPATRLMRLCYISDTASPELAPEIASRWEAYRFHDEDSARKTWRAPVSPYFHVIDANGRIAEKGVANAPDHLDRLLELGPFGRVITIGHRVAENGDRGKGGGDEK